MSFIYRCVIEDKILELQESFLGFITQHGKTTYDIKKMILDRLGKEKLDFEKCKGIGHDNAASITGLDFTMVFNVFYKT